VRHLGISRSSICNRIAKRIHVFLSSAAFELVFSEKALRIINTKGSEPSSRRFRDGPKFDVVPAKSDEQVCPPGFCDEEIATLHGEGFDNVAE